MAYQQNGSQPNVPRQYGSQQSGAMRGGLMDPVINASEEDRVSFIIRVYQHLALAVAAFIALETVLFMTGAAQGMYEWLVRSGGASWLLIMGGVMVMQWFASKSVANLDNPAAQYGGLFGMAAAQALIFAPFLYQVFNVKGGGTVASAAVVTGVGFVILSVVAFITRRDLSFIRPIVMWGFGAALLLIIGGTIFGFELGLVFSVGMVALSGGAILYQTQDIVRRYPTWAHIAASVALFSSLMTMFWYILRIFSRR